MIGPKKTQNRILPAFLILSLIALEHPAFSANPDPLQNLPKVPTAPTLITPIKKPNVIRCARKFVYQGRELDCDSNLDRDAEGLRPILQPVPAAIAELDRYQKTRKDIYKLSYAGGLGLFSILMGSFASNMTSDTKLANEVRTFGIGAGILIIGATLVTGFSSLKASQKDISNAVQIYNQARPNDPIELKFSTGVSF